MFVRCGDDGDDDKGGANLPEIGLRKSILTVDYESCGLITPLTQTYQGNLSSALMRYYSPITKIQFR